jgi:hypothetical protein
MVRKYKSICTQRPQCTCNSARCKWLKMERERINIAEALLMLSRQQPKNKKHLNSSLKKFEEQIH